jgi:hypothetical protein
MPYNVQQFNGGGGQPYQLGDLSSYMQQWTSNPANMVPDQFVSDPNYRYNNTDELVRSLYQDYLGRNPDQEGLNWWKQQSPALLAEGGEAKLRDEFQNIVANDRGKSADHTRGADFLDVKQTVPYANTLTMPQQQDWSAYMADAGQQQRGISNMPGVFNQYTALGQGIPEQSNALINATGEQQKARVADVNALWNLVGGLGSTPTTTTSEVKKKTQETYPDGSPVIEENMYDRMR